MTIVHKYKVGDKVRFKSKFPSPTTGLVGREGTVAEITGIGLNYNNKPHYYIDNITGGVFAESCFAGLATEPIFPSCDREAEGPDTLQADMPNHDTGENKAVWTWSETFECFVCSNCERSALNNFMGRSTDSRFCPNCGRLMTNSTVED